MAKKVARSRHVALILMEGETEEEFYGQLTDCYCHGKSKKPKNLHGNFSVNRKIVDAGAQFGANNGGDSFDVYVCIDQERKDCPAYNHKWCESELKKLPGFRRLIPVVVVLMIESLFFADIGGIYRFLRAENSKRKPTKYRQFRTLTHKDLSQLFKAFGKHYSKGVRCQNFVASLDLNRIIESADELKRMIQAINSA